MSLVTSKEIAKAIKLDRLGFLGTAVGWVLLHITRLSSLNKVYDKHKHLQGLDFINALLDDFQIDFELPEEDLRRIPKSGSFITVSNHPLGGIDGLLLLKILMQQRDDYKIVANFLLQRIAPIKTYVLPVNPFESRPEIKSVSGFKAALMHLKNGHALGLFPAGEVSTDRTGRQVVDKAWEEAAMKLVQKAEVPVLPVYFHAKNSPLFYRLARLGDVFRTAKLPSELLTQKERKIKIRIGNPISVADQQAQESLDEYTQFLRQKTYMLANTYDRKKLLANLPAKLKFPKTPKPIIEPIPVAEIENEIAALGTEKRLLVSKNYEVYLAEAAAIPAILQELGRLRELTFRDIGEGTNKELDLDVFDTYYHHMFLWDSEAKKIAGAYRMGLGKQIFADYGIDGFYLQALFRFEPELYPLMRESIEMGRAFIIKEYQQKPMPLFLLWKGIVHTTLRYPEHNYLIGGVSISDRFSNFSKSLMIEFMKSNYYDPYIAQFVRPKKEFKVKLKDADKHFVFDETKADLNRFDKVIDELEPGHLRLPVLIKKYIKQNAKVVAFNVDPRFNNSVDGLMYIRIADLPESTVKPVMEEFQAELESRFANRT